MSNLSVTYREQGTIQEQEVSSDQFESIEIDFIKKEINIHDEIFDTGINYPFSEFKRIEITGNEDQKSCLTIDYEFNNSIQTHEFDTIIIDFDSETVQMFQDYEEDEQQFQTFKTIKVIQ